MPIQTAFDPEAMQRDIIARVNRAHGIKSSDLVIQILADWHQIPGLPRHTTSSPFAAQIVHQVEHLITTHQLVAVDYTPPERETSGRFLLPFESSVEVRR